MSYLLDVNVLIALFDPGHSHYESAHSWFAQVGYESWATCPVTECGFVRVAANPSYPTIEMSVPEAMTRLAAFCGEPGHQFWADDISLRSLTPDLLLSIQGHNQITDVYLIALAHRHGGKLATLDARLANSPAVGHLDSIELIPTA